jgi:hypothetical protein
LRLGTPIPMNIEVPTKYQRSHNDRTVVFENRLHIKSPILYRPALHGNWNPISLARRALNDNFPMLTVLLTTVLQNRQVFLPDPIPCFGWSCTFRDTCGHKNCKFVRKLSKDNINEQCVPVPLPGHVADRKEPAAVFDVGQQILA